MTPVVRILGRSESQSLLTAPLEQFDRRASNNTFGEEIVHPDVAQQTSIDIILAQKLVRVLDLS